MENEPSVPGQMTSDNWNSFFKGVLIAGGGALVTYLAGFDFNTLGNWGPLLGAITAMIINLLRLWLGKQA